MNDVLIDDMELDMFRTPQEFGSLVPLFLTWIIFNPSMDK